MMTIIASVHRWKDESRRVKMFAQFCGVPEAGPPRSLDLLNFFLYMIKYTHGNPKHNPEEVGLGLNALACEPDAAFIELQHAERSAEWLHTECFQSSREVLAELATEFRTLLVEGDRLRRLPFDDWAECMTLKWTLELENTKRTLESMFISADVDSDGILTYDEFSALVEGIKPETSSREMTRMYQEALQTSHSDSLKPEDFVKVASDFGLLSHMMQSKEFATLQRTDDFGYLENAWHEEEDRIDCDLQELKASPCDEHLHSQLLERRAKFQELLLERDNLGAAWLCFRTLESGIQRALLRFVPDYTAYDDLETDSDEE